jgi:hypothetical protein
MWDKWLMVNENEQLSRDGRWRLNLNLALSYLLNYTPDETDSAGSYNIHFSFLFIF